MLLIKDYNNKLKTGLFNFSINTPDKLVQYNLMKELMLYSLDEEKTFTKDNIDDFLDTFESVYEQSIVMIRDAGVVLDYMADTLLRLCDEVDDWVNYFKALGYNEDGVDKIFDYLYSEPSKNADRINLTIKILVLETLGYIPCKDNENVEVYDCYKKIYKDYVLIPIQKGKYTATSSIYGLPKQGRKYNATLNDYFDVAAAVKKNNCEYYRAYEVDYMAITIDDKKYQICKEYDMIVREAFETIKVNYEEFPDYDFFIGKSCNFCYKRKRW